MADYKELINNMRHSVCRVKMDCPEWTGEYSCANIISEAADAIEELLAERDGKWIPCSKKGIEMTELMRREGIKWYGYKCSCCGFVYKGNALTESNYCQNCGANMTPPKEKEE